MMNYLKFGSKIISKAVFVSISIFYTTNTFEVIQISTSQVKLHFLSLPSASMSHFVTFFSNSPTPCVIH